MLRTGSDSGSQKLPSRLVAGARVLVRGSAWRITRVQPFASCTLVHLTGADRDNAGERISLLHPFDRFQPHRTELRLRVVRPRRWRHAFRRLLASTHPWDGLRAAASAKIDLLPYQLEPALAVVRGLSCRLLVADEVGLGKTIQAGVLLAELRERGWAERALVLTPAGLRRQWQSELAERFSIAATVVDRVLLGTRAAALPSGANPWLVDEVAIASIDLVKRPEGLRGLASVVWDLVIVDEAHTASRGTERYAAAHALAQRARRVVLLTATPHGGDADAFTALCRIGEHPEERLAMFRRSRAQVGFAGRRHVRTVPVHLARPEADMHRLLEDYSRRVLQTSETRDAVLAMAVLTKRALSGPVPLGISVARRLELLVTRGAAPAEYQPLLPLAGANDDEVDDRDLGPSGVLAAPGLSDRTRELVLLGRVAAAARAAGTGRKVRTLIRLIGRIREPAIVFTEYRDTLHHLAEALAPVAALALVHGGLSEAERAQAQLAFTSGAARVLLATDAAGEGLNLQRRCRLVINFEMPWNPTRLEQRIGRVDRLGQVRTVHAINLLAADTAEVHVMARLAARLGVARRDVGAVNDPLGVGAVLVGVGFAHDEPREGSEPHQVWQPDLRAEAEREVGRLRNLRTLAVAARRRRGFTGSTDDGVAPVTALRGHRLPGRRGSAIWLMRAHIVDGNGQLVEALLVPLAGMLRVVVRTTDAVRQLARQLSEAAGPWFGDFARTIAEERRLTIHDGYRTQIETARLRELGLLRLSQTDGRAGELFQAGLFDRRALREREAALHLRASARDAALDRVDRLAAARTISVADCEPVAMLVISG